MNSMAPFLIFYLGAALVALTRGQVRSFVMLAIPIVGAFNLFTIAAADAGTVAVFDYTLTYLRVDRLSLLFGYLFHLAAFIGIIFSLHLRDTNQHVTGVLYAGSALGAVFAGDLITLFVFWELLAVTSVFLILARRTERARAAAMRYLVIQVLSGVILLAGVLARVHETGSTAFNFIGLDGLGSGLIFLAFGIKCAFPLLHNWLTDAYPEATPTGTVFLSAFTTKLAVYALARGFPGTEVLVYIGAVMTMFPIFYAVIENDLRRVLGYSMINQIGFMVCGIGLGTELAINGAVSHAFNDVIFKALLFMSMGAVLFRTGKINGSELGGLYKSMPITTGLCIVGAASISAFPLFSGFVSKSMVMVAALEEGHPVVWLALLFASAGVFHHAGIKIPFFAFFAHDSGIRTREPPLNMLIAMGLAAAICIFNGSYPWALYSLLPFPVDYAPYTAAHVLTQSQLLFFSALAFCMLKLTGLYPPELSGINIDSEWFYRWLLPRTVKMFKAVFAPLDLGFRRAALGFINYFIASVFRRAGPDGMLARSPLAGGMVAWVLVLLAFYLLLNFL
ncbi:MAG TPA: Na(+)/H(+) antiporter subunit D [Rhodospirillales bacterium]|jgi:multicomponent Na+:H+ antiporter subunit D|nr:Na(+)/H(+) antiporter subunit D [Rhodospirillales bacterium]